MSMFRSVLALVASLVLATLVSASNDSHLEQRLEKLAVTLESARKEAHVPGMSIAIVKDDQVVWARGFGLADVAQKRPADEGTVYAIGSTTKAFTATLVGMLVDQKKVSWDDPVTKYLPYFKLNVRSPDKAAECTLRDLLSHRHGFSRMGILWFGSSVSRKDVLLTAAGAEPWDDFRAGFHYCNVTYLAAGEAAGVAAGSSWDEMIVKRIFKPLEMSASTLSIAEARKDSRLALGYKWDAIDEDFEPVKMVSLDSVAPAGSVNSNVIDIARWVRLQLGRGKTNGKRLISEESLLETWEPQIEMAPGASYGLGWMLREHNGRKVVEHGGNIDGFSAQIGLMPEEGLGYVLLMNLSVSPLQQASLPMVFDALLDEWPGESVATAVPTEPEDVDLADYVGLYVANFATFRDAEFEIFINHDRLAVDIPGQRKSDLKQPGADGRWVSTLTSSIAVSFDRDDLGSVTALRVHTNGYRFELPRKGLEIEPEAPVKGLEKFVGTFVRMEGGKRVKIFLRKGCLTMEDKGKWLAFNTPDEEGHASLRARADQGATFKTDADGVAESFVFHGNAGAQLFTRLVDTPDVDLPTLEEILALRKNDVRIRAVNADRGRKVSGKVWVAQAGVRGIVTVYSRGRDRFASHMEFGKFGRIDLVGRGREAWAYNSMRGFDKLKGDRLTQAILGHPGAIEGNWNDYFDSIEVIGNDTVNERPVHVVRLKKGGLPSRTYRVDVENGDLLRVKLISIEDGLRIPVTITYSDFKELNGIRSAQHVEIENPMSGKQVLTLEKVETDLDLGDEVFTLEDPETKKSLKE